jgi:hypothetical protein
MRKRYVGCDTSDVSQRTVAVLPGIPLIFQGIQDLNGQGAKVLFFTVLYLTSDSRMAETEGEEDLIGLLLNFGQIRSSFAGRRPSQGVRN